MLNLDDLLIITQISGIQIIIWPGLVDDDVVCFIFGHAVAIQGRVAGATHGGIWARGTRGLERLWAASPHGLVRVDVMDYVSRSKKPLTWHITLSIVVSLCFLEFLVGVSKKIQKIH